MGPPSARCPAWRAASGGAAAGWGGGQKRRDRFQHSSPPFSPIPLTCMQSLLDKTSGEWNIVFSPTSKRKVCYLPLGSLVPRGVSVFLPCARGTPHTQSMCYIMRVPLGTPTFLGCRYQISTLFPVTDSKHLPSSYLKKNH